MSNDKYPQFTVRLSDKSNQELEKLALIRSRSRSEIVREAMKVAKEKKKNNSEDKFIADPELNSKVIKVTSQM